MQAKALYLSNLIVEEDFSIVISWVSNKKTGSWKFDSWLHKIVDVASELRCTFSLVLVQLTKLKVS